MRCTAGPRKSRISSTRSRCVSSRETFAFGEAILRLNLAEVQPPCHDNAPAISVADFLGVLFQGRLKAVDQDRPVERFGQEAPCASL
jgi:hypothetical protein